MVKHSKYISLITDKGRCRDWSIKILGGIYNRSFNKGAGYIGGFTIYLTWNAVDRKSMYKPRKKLQFGITRNANNVPWTRH